jgi:hypothetical protein
LTLPSPCEFLCTQLSGEPWNQQVRRTFEMDEDDLRVAHSNLETDRMSQIPRWAGLIVATTIVAAVVITGRGDI